MSRDADNLIDAQWVAQCARRLRERWPHADMTTLDEVAAELWRDERLRSLDGEQAATKWLAPLAESRAAESPATSASR